MRCSRRRSGRGGRGASGEETRRLCLTAHLDTKRAPLRVPRVCHDALQPKHARRREKAQPANCPQPCEPNTRRNSDATRTPQPHCSPLALHSSPACLCMRRPAGKTRRASLSEANTHAHASHHRRASTLGLPCKRTSGKALKFPGGQAEDAKRRFCSPPIEPATTTPHPTLAEQARNPTLAPHSSHGSPAVALPPPPSSTSRRLPLPLTCCRSASAPQRNGGRCGQEGGKGGSAA